MSSRAPGPVGAGALRVACVRGTGYLQAVPYTLLAMPLRAALAVIFLSSAQAHAADWNTTLYLFEEEYRLPLLPPQWAAYLAVGIEYVTPAMLVLGLGTRLAALVLLAMTAVIEIFVYPAAWPTHLQWAAMLLVLVCRGPGAFSVDHLLQISSGRPWHGHSGDPDP